MEFRLTCVMKILMQAMLNVRAGRSFTPLASEESTDWVLFSFFCDAWNLHISVDYSSELTLQVKEAWNQ